MKDVAGISVKKCSECGIKNVIPMGTGHVVGVSQPMKEVNRLQYRCTDCRTHFWIFETEGF